MSEIVSALRRVEEEIALAAERAGRDPSEVTLVAVSKEVSPQRIREAIEGGQRDFGENRVSEAEEKHRALEDLPIRWHFVGRLQRNKVRRILEFVQTIHSVDRLALAEEIGRRSSAPVEVLLEINTSGERTKGGVFPEDLPRLAEAAAGIDGIRVAGLMTMAPVVVSPEDARPYFRKMASLQGDLRQKFPDMGIQHLSMGMSQDYAVAVEEGSTMVRVGQAIFGVRQKRR